MFRYGTMCVTCGILVLAGGLNGSQRQTSALGSQDTLVIAMVALMST